MTQKQKMIDLMNKCIETGAPVKITGINNKCGEDIERSRVSSIIAELKADGEFDGHDFYTYAENDVVGIDRSGPPSKKRYFDLYLATRDPVEKISAIAAIQKFMQQAMNTGKPVDVSSLDIGESKTRAYVSYVAKKHFNDAKFSVSRKGNSLSVIYKKNQSQLTQEKVLRLVDAAINSAQRTIPVPENMSIDLLRKNLSIIKTIPDYARYRISTKRFLNKFYLAVE